MLADQCKSLRDESLTDQCDMRQEIASTSKRNSREERHAVASVARECNALRHEVVRDANGSRKRASPMG